jgi:DNA-directed RNA polymerase specialized sigma24 family protein
MALEDLEREQPLGAEILREQMEEGRRLDEIATNLGRAHGTVRNDALRARRRLRAIIRERYPDLVPFADSRGVPNDAIA